MKNRRGLNNILSTDRKPLYIILSIIMVSVLTLTVVYAALSTTLNINGNAEVSAASWDIYLDNIMLNSQSATSNVPTITNSTTATFTTTLSKPGDFYEFTIDVVNNGSIDAMIDSVTKTPELSVEQNKYLNYIVEYQNGEAINTKQLVAKNSFVRLKVKLEFRKDITASDLPSTSETLDLSFTVNYTQADETGTNVTDNGVYTDPYAVGNEICYGEECFYVISSDSTSITMLAKYNLHAGNIVEEDWNVIPIENPTGKQDPRALGGQYDENDEEANFPWYGTISFTNEDYWWDYDTHSMKNKYITDSIYMDGTKIDFAYIYDSNSKLYPIIENYRVYLESLGANVLEARIIKISELIDLGCEIETRNCLSAPSWVYSTSYWTGLSVGDSFVFFMVSSGIYHHNHYSYDNGLGIRPVITISK